MQKTGDFESSVQCLTIIEEDQTKVFGGNGSGVKSEHCK